MKTYKKRETSDSNGRNMKDAGKKKMKRESTLYVIK